MSSTEHLQRVIRFECVPYTYCYDEECMLPKTKMTAMHYLIQQTQISP